MWLALIASEALAADAWMVIAEGSKDQAEAAAMFARYRAEQLPAAGGYPKLVDSATVTGLNPGFFVVVVGAPSDEESAKKMATELGRARSGAYVRKVSIADPEAVRCGATPDPRCGPAWRALVAFYLVGNGREQNQPRFESVLAGARERGIVTGWAASLDATRVPIVVGGQTVATIDIEPYSGELWGFVAAREGAEPRYIAWTDEHFVRTEAATYLGVNLE
jgi:hypothetical protein